MSILVSFGEFFMVSFSLRVTHVYVIHCLIFFSFSEIIISCTQLVPELLEFFWNLVYTLFGVHTNRNRLLFFLQVHSGIENFIKKLKTQKFIPVIFHVTTNCQDYQWQIAISFSFNLFLVSHRKIDQIFYGIQSEHLGVQFFEHTTTMKVKLIFKSPFANSI